MRTLILLALLAGCGGTTPATVIPRGTSEPIRTSEGSDALSARLDELTARLTQAGVERGEFEGRGFLAMRERNTFELELPARACMTIVSFASSGITDLDATLYGPEGDVLAEDTQPDPHPSIQICAAGEARRAYYSLNAYDGAGAFVFASFVGDRRALDTTARAVGGRPGLAPGDVVATVQSARLRELGEGAARRGFALVGEPSPVPLVQGQTVRVPLPVEAGFCYTVAAFAQGQLLDANLRVLDDLGVEVARDVSSAADASLQFCATRTAPFVSAVEAVSGGGDAQVAVFRASAAALGGTSGLWLGNRRHAVMADAAIAPASGRSSRLLGGRLRQGEAVDREVPIAANRCVTFVARGGAGTAELALRVVDARNGTVRAASEGARGGSRATVCTGTALRAEVQLVSRGGTGDYVLESSTFALPAALPEGATPADVGPLLDATQALGRDLAGVRGHALPAHIEVPLQGDACAVVHVVTAGSGAVEVALKHGDTSTERRVGAQVEIGVCGAGSTIELRAAPGRDAQRAFVIMGAPAGA